MEYYIQGNAANAEQIRAAFKAKGISDGGNSFIHEEYLYFSEGGEVDFCGIGGHIANIIKTHPDYKELELPVDPKFKVNAWIISNITKDIYQVKDVPEYFKLQAQGQYRLQSYTDGSIAYFWKNDVENTFHLWTIADAKDGDVLVTTKIRGCPFIYRKTSYKNNLAYYYAGIDGNGDFCEGCLKRTLSHFGLVSDVVPATKEQRDRLFDKMKEAGYTWDADNKELKKIPKHYDIANFQPKQWVLVRDRNDWEWNLTMFSYLHRGSSFLFICINGVSFKQCIPLEGNEKLLGTTDMPSEEYINWKT